MRDIPAVQPQAGEAGPQTDEEQVSGGCCDRVWPPEGLSFSALVVVWLAGVFLLSGCKITVHLTIFRTWEKWTTCN